VQTPVLMLYLRFAVLPALRLPYIPCCLFLDFCHAWIRFSDSGTGHLITYMLTIYSVCCIYNNMDCAGFNADYIYICCHRHGFQLYVPAGSYGFCYGFCCQIIWINRLIYMPPVRFADWVSRGCWVSAAVLPYIPFPAVSRVLPLLLLNRSALPPRCLPATQHITAPTRCAPCAFCRALLERAIPVIVFST